MKRLFYTLIFCLLCSPVFAGGVLMMAGGVESGGTPNPATTFIGSGQYDSGSETILPLTSHASGLIGDLVFAHIYVNTNTVSVPDADFTLLVSYTDNADKHYIYYKIEDADGAQAYSWTMSGAGKFAGTLATYRGGFDGADPIDDFSDVSYRTSDANVIAGEITATESDENLLFVGGMFTSNLITTFTGPTTQGNGWTEDVEIGDQNSSDFRRFVYSCQWSGSGASGTATAVADQTATVKHAFMIALNPE